MANSKIVDFDSFWKRATKAGTNRNGFAYHSCCDVWTTRAAEAQRITHKWQIPLSKIISGLKTDIDGQKQALYAMMMEEEWRIPVLLNESCKARPRSILQQQVAFRHHQPGEASQELQERFAAQNTAYSGQVPSEVVTSSSKILFT